MLARRMEGYAGPTIVAAKKSKAQVPLHGGGALSGFGSLRSFFSNTRAIFGFGSFVCFGSILSNDGGPCAQSTRKDRAGCWLLPAGVVRGRSSRSASGATTAP